jgi:hypothetical protein
LCDETPLWNGGEKVAIFRQLLAHVQREILWLVAWDAAAAVDIVLNTFPRLAPFRNNQPEIVRLGFCRWGNYG